MLGPALHAIAAQIEKLMRAYRRVGRLDAHELNYYHDDDGSLVIRARLPAEEGAVVQ